MAFPINFDVSFMSTFPIQESSTSKVGKLALLAAEFYRALSFTKTPFSTLLSTHVSFIMLLSGLGPMASGGIPFWSGIAYMHHYIAFCPCSLTRNLRSCTSNGGALLSMRTRHQLARSSFEYEHLLNQRCCGSRYAFSTHSRTRRGRGSVMFSKSVHHIRDRSLATTGTGLLWCIRTTAVHSGSGCLTTILGMQTFLVEPGEIWPDLTVKVPLPGFEAAMYHEFFISTTMHLHPNILRPIAVMKNDTLRMATHLAFPFLGGGNLQSRLSQHTTDQPMSVMRSLSILKPTIEAIHFMHNSGFIHRDLKPENILFAHELSLDPVVGDMGLACLAGTVMHQFTGTHGYAPPEAIMLMYNHGAAEAGVIVSPEYDTYAICVMAFQMLTGATVSEMASSMLNGQIGELLEERVDHDLAHGILQGLALRPGDRTPLSHLYTLVVNSYTTVLQAAALSQQQTMPQPELPCTSGPSTDFPEELEASLVHVDVGKPPDTTSSGVPACAPGPVCACDVENTAPATLDAPSDDDVPAWPFTGELADTSKADTSKADTWNSCDITVEAANSGVVSALLETASEATTTAYAVVHRPLFRAVEKSVLDVGDDAPVQQVEPTCVPAQGAVATEIHLDIHHDDVGNVETVAAPEISPYSRLLRRIRGLLKTPSCLKRERSGSALESSPGLISALRRALRNMCSCTRSTPSA